MSLFKKDKYPFTLAPIKQGVKTYYIRAKFKMTEKQIKDVIKTASFQMNLTEYYITIKGKEAPKNAYAGIEFDVSNEPFKWLKKRLKIHQSLFGIKTLDNL